MLINLQSFSNSILIKEGKIVSKFCLKCSNLGMNGDYFVLFGIRIKALVHLLVV